jgi:23S rRNA U2552 (ribose-2'-O)-methylase RlmE/FtsJ
VDVIPFQHIMKNIAVLCLKHFARTKTKISEKIVTFIREWTQDIVVSDAHNRTEGF